MTMHARYGDLVLQLVEGRSVPGRELLRLRGLARPDLLIPEQSYKLRDAATLNVVIDACARLADAADDGNAEWFQKALMLLQYNPQDFAAGDERRGFRATWFELASLADFWVGLRAADANL